MRPLSRTSLQMQTDETLQRLLAIAAEYEPEDGPPCRLVADALERASRQSPVRRPTAMLGWAAAVGILGLLVLHRISPWPASDGPTTTAAHLPAAEPINAKSPSPALAALAPEKARVTRSRMQERQSGLVRLATRPGLAKWPRRLRTARQSPPPSIQLKVETVHRYHAGLLAPAVIAEHDETTGQETFVPAIVDLPLVISADDSGGAGWLQLRPASHEP